VQAVRIPVIGSGGVMNARDALEFLAIGAVAVQVGTASFVRPLAALDVLEGIGAELEASGAPTLDAWREQLRERAATAHAGGPSLVASAREVEMSEPAERRR
jgi:dihydroorotate dehydrogenase (NAD+) catalytic subunit